MEKIMEDRISVLIVLEREQVKKIDEIAGKGRRSAYIRGLIDISNEEQVEKEIKLKEKNKVLEQTVAELKQRLGMNTTIVTSIVERTFSEYRKWKAGMENSGGTINLQNELNWITMRARSINVTPIDFLGTLHSMAEEMEKK